MKIDLDDVDFDTATHIVGLLTASFYVPLDSRHVLVARDTKEQRDEFMRQDFETIYLPGLNEKDLTDVSTLAKNIFDVQQATTEATTNTITIRAPQRTLDAFNDTLRLLLDGHSQVMLEVRVIQVAHTSTRDTGAQLPQQVGAYNLYTEEESILKSNATEIQEIISSRLASANDLTAILGILIAAGDVSSTLFSNGIATFGNGKTLTGVSPGSITANFELNSSDTRELDDLHLRLGDGEATTIKSGTKYPIQTSQYSSVGVSSSTIAGLTGAGTSSTLSSLLASYSSSSLNVPMVEYQDLGLTLKATPKVLRSDDVALTLEMKIDALSGSSLDGNPELNNRAYTGVVTVKAGETMELVSELTKTESRAVSGTPGISEIPGLSSLTGDDKQKDYATLLILITPHVIRGPQAAGHSPMMRVETKQAGH